MPASNQTQNPKKSRRVKQPREVCGPVFDIRRFFMPNVDKVVKNVMHEISDGKTALREAVRATLRNQEIIIAQNKHVIGLLEQINAKLGPQRELSQSPSIACFTDEENLD